MKISAISSSRGGEAPVVVHDCLGGNAGDGGDDVVLGHAELFACLYQFVGKRITEGLAARGLGRLVREILVLQEFVNERLVDDSALAYGAVFVVLLGAIGEVPDHGVHEDVAGARVEVVAGIDAAVAVWGNEAHVSSTADVLACAGLGRVMQEQSVEEGDERGALAAGGLVTDAEVGNGGDSRAGSEDGALGNCAGALCLARFGHGEEPDGLAVGAEDD